MNISTKIILMIIVLCLVILKMTLFGSSDNYAASESALSNDSRKIYPVDLKSSETSSGLKHFSISKLSPFYKCSMLY